MENTVIIPTLNAGENLPRLLEKLRNQTVLPKEIIIIDSSSGDATAEIASANGCLVKTIKRNDFRHGRARNYGARLASGEVLVFMTQDAIPVNFEFLHQLTRPILDGEVAASFARQIPFDNATPLEVFARGFNYPSQSNIRSIEKVGEFGFKTFFFSDVASAFDRSIFQALNGFSENVIAIEDMEICARLLNSGYKISYVAEAQVYHSHNYGLTQVFKRYFDTGVFHSQCGDVFNKVKPNGEGFKFFRKALRYLIDGRSYGFIPYLFVETLVKWSSFNLGLHNNIFPLMIKYRLSNHKLFWERNNEI